MNCSYHPIYLSCSKCGRDMERGQERECTYAEPPHPERVKALREARAHIKNHAVMTWNGGLTERSDGITDVLVDFDLKFPEALDP
jgi:hypothetical protein